MNLHLLYAAPQVEIYFDSHNDWLYVDWMGDITLPIVQAACAHVAHCFVAYPYPRVLNNNTHVTSLSWSVAPWLISHFLPHLRLAGVQQLAWVCSLSVPCRSMAQAVVTWLPHIEMAIFDDVEDGAAWLHRGRRVAGNDYPYAARTAVSQRQVEAVVQELAQQAGLVHSVADHAA